VVPIGWEAARGDGMSGTAGNPPMRDPNDMPVSVGSAIIMGYPFLPSPRTHAANVSERGRAKPLA